jgi:cytochrome c oxidase assembly factor CtaG
VKILTVLILLLASVALAVAALYAPMPDRISATTWDLIRLAPWLGAFISATCLISLIMEES